MNNTKRTITKGGIQISIYILIWHYKCLLSYNNIYTYLFQNKRVFKCETTSSPYLFAI